MNDNLSKNSYESYQFSRLVGDSVLEETVANVKQLGRFAAENTLKGRGLSKEV